MVANFVLQAVNALFVILFQVVMSPAVLSASEEPLALSNSRSAFFETRQDARLMGHVLKWFEARSFMSCNQMCARESWCMSTNFKAHSKKDGEGICELNKHDPRRLIDEYETLRNEEGVTFSLLLRECLVTGCFNGGSCLLDEKNKTFSCFKKPPSGSNSEVPTACIPKALGMEDGLTADNKLTASSTSSPTSWGRLHCSEGSWTPSTDYGEQWFQVDFVPEVKLITNIVTQGNGKSWWWVTQYYVMYASGGAALQEYKENDRKVIFYGNSNKDGEVKNKINNPFQADTVRIIPILFSGRIALRIELYGCDI